PHRLVPGVAAPRCEALGRPRTESQLATHLCRIKRRALAGDRGDRPSHCLHLLSTPATKRRLQHKRRRALETLTGLVSWLENTALAQFITQSTIAFPAIEVVHVIAIALVFGTIAIVDLRLLGLGSNNRAVTELCRDVLPWTWGAYAIAAITGSLLFI